MSTSPGAATTTIEEIALLGPALAVVAHPDDESFGLGAVLAGLARAGGDVRVLSFTHGEASTLGVVEDMAQHRARELACACEHLGVSTWALHDFPDGRLGEMPPADLDRVVEAALDDAATVVAFEPGGVTGHPDHRAATAAAQRAADRHALAVVHWGVAPGVAARLNGELGTGFVAFDGDAVAEVGVDRTAQRAAMACHASQLCDNPVVARRLELEGDVQRIRVCRPPADAGAR